MAQRDPHYEEMKLNSTSSYAAALRPALRREVFRPAPLRLLWLPAHYAVVGLGTVAIAYGRLPLPLQLLCSLFIGASFAGLTFVGHEALHGAIVRNRFLRRLVGRLGFLPFAVPPRLWEAWHNRVHHGNTNRPGVDPDTYPTLAEYQQSAMLRHTTDWLAPGRSRLAGVFSLLVGFSVQSTHMLLTARGRKFLSRSAHLSGLLEAGAVWALLALLALALGPAAFVLAFVLPLIVGNTIIMSFILTNHNLSPQTTINDPLVNSLSVSGPRWIEWLTLGFGFHVEHHLFPAVSGRYGRELAVAVRRAWPERYQSRPYFQALLLLHRSPRVYETETMLVDPRSGRVWPTLVPSRADSVVPELLDSVVGSGASEPSLTVPSRKTALVLSLTAIACASPATRPPQAKDDLHSHASRAQLRSEAPISELPAQFADAADAVDAHRAPPATTAASAPPGAAPEAPADDAELVERIRAALLAGSEPVENASNIGVVSQRGHVLVSGPVRDEAERTRVESAILKIRGVVRLDSRLVVKGP